jgi:hypothetical protein
MRKAAPPTIAVVPSERARLRMMVPVVIVFLLFCCDARGNVRTDVVRMPVSSRSGLSPPCEDGENVVSESVVVF